MEERIIAHLAQFRAKNKKSQKEMAVLLGVSYATYQEIEQGIIKKLDTLRKLKEKTGFSPETGIHVNGHDPKDVIIQSLSETVNQLSKRVGELIEIVNHTLEINSLAKEENLLIPDDLKESLWKIARSGIPAYWGSLDEGLITLGKLLIADAKAKIS